MEGERGHAVMLLLERRHCPRRRTASTGYHPLPLRGRFRLQPRLASLHLLRRRGACGEVAPLLREETRLVAGRAGHRFAAYVLDVEQQLQRRGAEEGCRKG